MTWALGHLRHTVNFEGDLKYNIGFQQEGWEGKTSQSCTFSVSPQARQERVGVGGVYSYFTKFSDCTQMFYQRT